MFEIERKYRVADPDGMVRKLLGHGAVPGPVSTQSDQYFAHPCRDFAATDEALRLRTADGQTVLTYKGPAADHAVKTRQEIELPVGGDTPARSWAGMLQYLGFRPVLLVEKIRQTFTLSIDGWQFSLALDQVAGLGWYLEIELLATPDGVPAAQAAVQALADAWHLETPEARSYLEMLLAHATMGTI